MSRLSFEKKRVQQPVAHPAMVQVRVSGEGSASVGGTSVVAAPGEEIQHAVLNHLQRLAISLGTPIRATIHDDRAGCVVPLEVSADGSSRVAGDPVRVAPRGPQPVSARPVSPKPVAPAAAGKAQAPTGQFGPPPVMDAPSARVAVPDTVDAPPASAAVPECDSAPKPDLVSAPAPKPDLVSASAPKPDLVSASAPKPDLVSAPAPKPDLVSASAPKPDLVSTPTPKADAVSVTAVKPAPVLAPAPKLAPLLDPEPAPVASATPTPARGFDAVAEEVLGDEPVTETAEGAELLTEPMARINEAVRSGRIEVAAELADRTVVEASGVLGPRHAEVLHLRELTAYIAYLAGDPVRSFELSLDLARMRRQAADAEGAYGNVRSAATAWRAVRDPEEGLRMGRDLIGLWTDLMAEPGPAAEDPQPLESARARMVRLADRAAKAAQAQA
ncbi:tetratricopeptide repeat protein [Streptomyces sp. NPDC016566]|uniref:tetratricopeptide repeat protein n=1 Tax=Streptomyces sp. NPDC016566 TaxID=3364967 RepID=UPI0036F6AE23